MIRENPHPAWQTRKSRAEASVDDAVAELEEALLQVSERRLGRRMYGRGVEPRGDYYYDQETDAPGKTVSVGLKDLLHHPNVLFEAFLGRQPDHWEVGWKAWQPYGWQGEAARAFDGGTTARTRDAALRAAVGAYEEMLDRRDEIGEAVRAWLATRGE